MSNITISGELESRVKELEEFIKEFFSLTSEGIASYEQINDDKGKSDDFIIADVNPAYEKITGFKKEEILGKRVSDVYGSEIRPFIPIFIRTEQTGIPETFEAFFGAINKYFSISVFSPGKGKFVSIFHDVTRNRELEGSIEESEKKYQELLKSAPSGIYEINYRTKRFVSVNDSMCQLTGYSRDELLAMDPSSLMDDEGRRTFQQRINKWLKGEKPDENTEYTIRAKDGHIIYAYLNTKFTVDQNGNPAGATVVAHDITERKKAEMALKESEQHFKLLFETMSPGAVYQDKDGNIISMNPAAEKILGKTRSDFLGSSSVKEEKFTIHEDGSPFPGVEHPAMIALKKGIKVNNVVMGFYNPRMESYRWINIDATPLFHEGEKRPYQVYTTFTDITEQKQSEINVRQNELKLRSFYESGLIGVFYWNSSGTITDANDKFLEMTGYTREDLESGKINVHEITPPEFKQADKRSAKELLETGVTRTPFEKEYFRKDGTRITILVAGATLDSDSSGSVAYVMDISERKKYEAELIRAKEKLNIALQTGDIGLWEWDLRTDVHTWDERMEKIFGLEPGTFAGSQKAFEDMINEEDLSYINKLNKQSIIKDSPYEMILRTKPIRGKIRYLSCKALIHKDANGKAVSVTGISVDVTDLKESTDQLILKLNEELLRSNRELENFAYVASHDLQEPLRMVTSFTQLLEMQYGDNLDSRAHEYINYAVDGAKRMYELLNGLLTYSRINTKGDEFTEVDLNKTIEVVKKNLRLIIKERKAIIRTRHLPLVSADENQMIHLFQNLISNGIKFSKGAPKISISSKTEKDQYILSVSDKGIGIEKIYFEKVFKIFQRLMPRDQYEGTGIGLALCKRIVERHGGNIWVESKPGKGSTIFFTLPKTSSSG